MKSKVGRVCLYLFIVSAGLLSGGSVFEHLVLTPLWAGAPPESVAQWQHGGVQAKFFRVVTPVYALSSVALLGTGWLMPKRQRFLALLAGTSGLIVVAATFLFFIPILNKTQISRGAGLTGEEITRLVRDFVAWNWARWATLLGGWITGLAALASPVSDRLPSEVATETSHGPSA